MHWRSEEEFGGSERRGMGAKEHRGGRSTGRTSQKCGGAGRSSQELGGAGRVLGSADERGRARRSWGSGRSRKEVPAGPSSIPYVTHFLVMFFRLPPHLHSLPPPHSPSPPASLQPPSSPSPCPPRRSVLAGIAVLASRVFVRLSCFGRSAELSGRGRRHLAVKARC